MPIVRAFAARPGWIGSEPPPVSEADPVLAALARQEQYLSALYWLLVGMKPQGRAVMHRIGLVSLSVPEIRDFDPPLAGITLINDGPGNAIYRIPKDSPSDWQTILATEQLQIAYTQPAIKSISMLLSTGVLANVRLVCLY